MPAVKSNAFLLGEATLMVAPYSDPTSVFELTPDVHSLGMIRNLALAKEADEVELRKGIRQLLVDSQESNVRVSLSAEIFEFNAQNLYYSLSQAKTAIPPKRGVLKTAVTGPQATIVVNTDPIPGESATGISTVGDIPIGATVVIQRADDGSDYVLPVKVTATTTLSTADYTVTVAIPVGMSFPAGSKVWIVNEIAVGSLAERDFFKVKAVSTLSNNKRPIVAVIPKVKITKGFQLSFDETNYTSMPFEFRPYFLTQSEITGRLSEIGTNKQVHVYASS